MFVLEADKVDTGFAGIELDEYAVSTAKLGLG